MQCNHSHPEQGFKNSEKVSDIKYNQDCLLLFLYTKAGENVGPFKDFI